MTWIDAVQIATQIHHFYFTVESIFVHKINTVDGYNLPIVKKKVISK